MTYRSVDGGSRSLWHARFGTVREVEFAVVGAGWVGLSTAYWLAKAGRDVLVVEADTVAARASGRNAGFLITGSAEPFPRLAKDLGEARALAFWKRTAENRELVRSELLDNGRIDCDFLPEGSWIAALDDDDKVVELRAGAEWLQTAGFPVEWVEGEALRKVSGSPRLGGALYQGRDGGLDPVRLCRGLAALPQSEGGFEILTGARVTAISRGQGPGGDGVRLQTLAGEVAAHRAVVTVNAAIPSLIPQLAAEVRPVRGQMLACGPYVTRDLRGVWYIDDGFQYLRQLADGTLVLGGCRNVAPEEEVGTLERPTATIQEALENFLEDAFPHLASRPVQHRWAGIMAFTPNGLPSIGAIPHLPAALYAAGFNGHGMSLGFVAGRYLAERLLTGSGGEGFL